MKKEKNIYLVIIETDKGSAYSAYKSLRATSDGQPSLRFYTMYRTLKKYPIYIQDNISVRQITLR